MLSTIRQVKNVLKQTDKRKEEKKNEKCEEETTIV